MTGEHRNSRPAVTRNSFWSRRGMLTAGSVAGVGALTGGMVGCSGGSSTSKEKANNDKPPKNLNQKGFPIVDNPVTINFMTSKPPTSINDWNKAALWNKYQKMTNVRVKWGLVPAESVDEKRNLSLSSGDYPDGFYANTVSSRDQLKYGSQGVFIKVNDLIDKYMPNLKKIINDQDDIRRGMTFPDGNMYGLPFIAAADYIGSRIDFKQWVRRDWLDKFDMDMPATTVDYYKYLKAVKSKHPNGKEKTVPYGDAIGLGLYTALRGAFGVGNRRQSYVDVEPDDEDKARFFPATDGYKALMEYLHKLYRDGLIEKNVFSIDQAKEAEGINKGVYGSTVAIAPSFIHGGQAKHFDPMPALKGPEGHREYNYVYPSLKLRARLVITDNCKHPEVVARWNDYFYTDEGATMYFMGVEGESYKKTNDGVEYVDKIKNPPKGKTQEDAKTKYVTYGNGGTGAVIVKQEYFKGAETSAESVKAAKLLEPDARKVLKSGWPDFTYTDDESKKLDSVADDIEKYVDESRDKFISGDLKLSNWKTYVQKLKKMGLDDYMEIQQAAYDRYRKA